MKEGLKARSLPIISVKHASAWLAEHAPMRDAKQWELWLRNNRMPNRAVAYRVPYAKGAKKVFYSMANLERIGHLESSKQHSLADLEWIAANQ